MTVLCAAAPRAGSHRRRRRRRRPLAALASSQSLLGRSTDRALRRCQSYVGRRRRCLPLSSLWRFLVEDTPPDGRRGPLARNARQCPAERKQARPHQTSCEIVLHLRQSSDVGGAQLTTPAFPGTARPSTIVSTTSRFARSYCSSLRGSSSKIQPVRACSIAP